MFNTKQVRAIGKAFCGYSAQYTDKTGTKDAQRRSVVWMLIDGGTADALAAHFKQLGAEVTRTGTEANMWTHSGGWEYVRVKAALA